MRKSIIFLALTTLLYSCGNSTDEGAVENEGIDKEVVLSADMYFSKLVELDQKLMNADLSIDKEVAKELFSTASVFESKYPAHEKTADALELAAKGAESIGKYNEAIELLHHLANDFEASEKTPSYLYNKGRILEEKLGKKENAKAAYNELISKYPEHPLAVSAEQYLQMNYMEMSDEELIQFLEGQNNVAK